MAYEYQKYMGVPTAAKTITDTTVNDVTEYATAQVVDSNLVAGNIKKDTVILGVTGTFEGGITPTGTIEITPLVTTQYEDVTNYEEVEVNPIYEEVSTTATMAANLTSANIGKMYKFTGTSASGYYNGGLYIVENDETANDYLCFTASTAGSTVGMSITGTPEELPTLEYSSDKSTWTAFTIGTTTVTLTNAGDKVYFRGDNDFVNSSTSNYIKFVMTGSIAASGNIMSLLDKTCESLALEEYACFYKLFDSCTSLTTPPSLPATTISDSCYLDMFYNCTNLISAPSLPATTLYDYCYSDMFSGCSSLITAPELPAENLATGCYSYMLESTGITSAPELPATTMYERCYNGMFGYTPLTTVPNLPATTLTTECYRKMFQGCASLYVSDESISGTAEQTWYIPESGTATGDYTMENMFEECSGTRSTDSPNFNGVQKLYYTQNTPV